MKTSVRWLQRCGALILMGVMVSACGQPSLSPSKTAELAKTTASKTEPAQSGAVAQATPAAPAPAIATFQTQQRQAGFSADGQHFIHLESWRDTGAGIPHAAMQVVNLATNTCVANGCVRTRLSEAQAGQSIATAENDLLNKTQQLRRELNIAAPVPGQTLPVVARSRTADGTETVTVRLQNNQPLQLTLKQKQVKSALSGGTAEKDQAAMKIAVSHNGQTRSLGSFNQMYDWMLDFSIREVQQSPDGKTLAILVTGAERAFEGTLGITMVQGLAL